MASVEPQELLWAWLREGWRYRMSQGWDPRKHGADRVTAQVKREMAEILNKGYESYFLLVSDIVRWAKDHGIAVGPGRGSSAASVVCFLLRITEPDPLDFPLTDFSRFIDPTRTDLPDIDIDFEDQRRAEVEDYIIAKYGAEYVGKIGNFTKYKGKNSIKDVGRVFEIPVGPLEALKGMVVERSGGDSRADASLIDTFEMFPQALAILEEYPKLKYAVALEGNYKTMSTHAAGVVVTSTPVSDVTAMYTREVAGIERTVVAVDKYDAEYLNLMKIDILGLSTMGMIALALADIGMTLEELYRIPLDDPTTIEAFRRNDVIGVFQFEGRATRLVGRDLKPDNIFELIDVNALSRPGPLFSGTTAEYIDVKWKRRQPFRIHPVIDEIAAGTRGQIIYQEQILHVLARFGGLSVTRVHEIRRIISKKLGEAQFNTSALAFAENANRLHGVSKELAMEVWSRVVTSASYAFVYSHSLSYTIIGYWAMWLKVHHAAAFYRAQLMKSEEDAWARIIRDAERHDVRVRGVKPGVSGETWTRTGTGEVRAGYLQLKGIGPGKVKAIIAHEAIDPLRTADDMLRVKGIGPAILEKFRPQIESEDPFGLHRVARVLEATRAEIGRGELPLSPPTVTSDEILDTPGDSEVVWLGLVKLKEYKDAIEDERSRTGKPLDEIKAGMKDPHLPTGCVLHCYDDGDEDVYVRVTRWQYPRFKEGLTRIRPGVDLIWVRAYKRPQGFGASIYLRELVIIDPDAS